MAIEGLSLGQLVANAENGYVSQVSTLPELIA